MIKIWILSAAIMMFSANNVFPRETPSSLPLASDEQRTTQNSLETFNVFLKDFGYDFLSTAKEQFDAISKLLEKNADKLQRNLYLLPGNYEKNRLACRVFPYDHNIISSKSVPYANGSTIHVPEFSSHSYIATQAPLESTIQDLFMLMKEKKCSTLISLVMPFEPKLQNVGGVTSINMIERCADYWSRERIFENGHTLSPSDKEPEIIAFEHTEQSIVIRKLTLRDKEGEEHEIEQIHYQHWPDHGNPDPIVFDKLNERVNLKLQAERLDTEGPLVVHCHAGSGRSGVLIAIRLIQDYIEEQRKLGKELSEIKINIPKMIYEMKLCREMLSSFNQYEFILSWTKTYIERLN